MSYSFKGLVLFLKILFTCIIHKLKEHLVRAFTVIVLNLHSQKLMAHRKIEAREPPVGPGTQDRPPGTFNLGPWTKDPYIGPKTRDPGILHET